MTANDLAAKMNRRPDRGASPTTVASSLKGAPDEETTRLNADIPVSLKKRLSIAAVNHNTRARQIVIDALERHLDELDA